MGNSPITKGQFYKGPDWASKEWSPEEQSNKLFGGSEYIKNQEFGRTHPDAAPPAKGQTYDSFTKAYGDAHPQKAEIAQSAPEKNNISTTPAPLPVEPVKTLSTPQAMQYAKAGSAAPAASPAATPQSPRVSPQASQMPQGALAARAANQMAGAEAAKQYALPNVGQISFGGS
jgi:hypothetical protein